MGYFVRPPEAYHRNLDILEAYYQDMAFIMFKYTNLPYNTCYNRVRHLTSEGNRLAFHDKQMNYVGKLPNQDRTYKRTTFLSYINTTVKHHLLVSPSLTVYQNPKVKKSLLSLYMDEVVTRRSTAKKMKFKFKQENKPELAQYYENTQQTTKILANALSGAHGSESTILFCKTIHSTLTSLCRSASSYGNANNEKLIGGNRHYWSPDIVLANIAATIRLADLTKIHEAMVKYHLRPPTPEEVMVAIRRSSQFYWDQHSAMAKITRVVERLTDLERATFLYVGDFYHLKQCNPSIIDRFLRQMANRHVPPVEDPLAYLSRCDSTTAVLVSFISGDLLQGKALSFITDLPIEHQQQVGGIAKHILDTMDEYSFFIEAFFKTDVMPCSIAHLPTIMRRVAVTSDTDSTIFTVKEWVDTAGDDLSLQERDNIGHVVSYLASSTICHILAQLSRNLGVEDKELFRYSMKSEFYFPAYCLTSRAKTYFAYKGAEEGRVFKEGHLEEEIKGAVLKSSNKPEFIRQDVKALIHEILGTVVKHEKIELRQLLKRVSKIEKTIQASIEKGETSFYSRHEIKTAESYKLNEMKSPYFHYLLWQRVFAPKYGEVVSPPYRAFKITIDTERMTDFKVWLEGIEDAAIQLRMREFLQESGKDKLKTFLVPESMVESVGIPIEILKGVNIRKIVANLVEPYMVILETLRYYSIDKNQSRLVSDTY